MFAFVRSTGKLNNPCLFLFFCDVLFFVRAICFVLLLVRYLSIGHRAVSSRRYEYTTTMREREREEGRRIWLGYSIPWHLFEMISSKERFCHDGRYSLCGDHRFYTIGSHYCLIQTTPNVNAAAPLGSKVSARSLKPISRRRSVMLLHFQVHTPFSPNRVLFLTVLVGY